MIEGYVAEVLNDREVAINRGGDDNVIVGMEFAVLEPAEIPITDPENQNRDLGSVQAEKIRVRIISVHPKFSVGRTFQRYGGRKGLAWTYQDIFASEPSKVRTLRTVDAVALPISSGESYVHRGDPVRQIEPTD